MFTAFYLLLALDMQSVAIDTQQYHNHTDIVEYYPNDVYNSDTTHIHAYDTVPVTINIPIDTVYGIQYYYITDGDTIPIQSYNLYKLLNR